jgi:hypothetical protein
MNKNERTTWLNVRKHSGIFGVVHECSKKEYMNVRDSTI